MLEGDTIIKLILNAGAQKIVVNWVKKLNLAIFQGMLAPKLQELTRKRWLGMTNNKDCIKQT